MRRFALYLSSGFILAMVLVGSASAFAITVGDARIGSAGGTGTVDIQLDQTTAGLAGYNLTVSVADPAVAEIVSVTYPDWAVVHANSDLPASTAWVKSADLNDRILASSKDVSLASVTMRGKTDGTTTVAVTVTKMDDDFGNVSIPAAAGGTISVGSQAVSASGSGNFLLDLIAQIVAFIKGLLGLQ